MNPLTSGSEWVIVCFPCRIDVDGHTDTSEAQFLAGVHNDLHHGSRPEAFIIPAEEYDRPPFEACEGFSGVDRGHLRIDRGTR